MASLLLRQAILAYPSIFLSLLCLACVLLYSCRHPGLVPSFRPAPQIMAIQSPRKYPGMEDVRESVAELPICVLTFDVQEGEMGDIVRSVVEQQGHSHYTHVIVKSLAQIETSADAVKYSLQAAQLLTLILTRCPPKSIALVARAPLRPLTLATVSLAYQHYDIWMIGNLNSHIVGDGYWGGVTAVYAEVLASVNLDDYYFRHDMDPRAGLAAGARTGEHIKELSVQELVLNLHKLSLDHILQVHPLRLFTQPPRSPHLDHLPVPNPTPYSLLPVTEPMTLLRPQFLINHGLMRGSLLHVQSTPHPTISPAQLQLAWHLLNAANMPHNHRLWAQEELYYGRRYGLMDAGGGQWPYLCVVVPSVNNAQNWRYRYVVDSIARQQYEGDRVKVVFIDDASSDGTYELTQEYMRTTYPGLFNRTLFIKNEVRKYATYNIRNAVHNHCPAGSVIVLVDGDDQLLGRQVFRLIGHTYATRDVWLAYTNHLTNAVAIGVSKPVPSPDTQFYTQGVRVREHFVSALRTFKRELYMRIREQDHLDDQGQYFDTMYDQAMVYPMVEMAGSSRVLYLPELAYFYNRFYGANDDSTTQKSTHRAQIQEQVLARNRYARVDIL